MQVALFRKAQRLPSNGSPEHGDFQKLPCGNVGWKSKDLNTPMAVRGPDQGSSNKFPRTKFQFLQNQCGIHLGGQTRSPSLWIHETLCIDSFYFGGCTRDVLKMFRKNLNAIRSCDFLLANPCDCLLSFALLYLDCGSTKSTLRTSSVDQTPKEGHLGALKLWHVGTV